MKASVPGRGTLVQRKAGGGTGNEPDGPEVHAAAKEGTSGAAGPLPFLSTIQKAFGRHDVSGIQAHTGAEAAKGAEAMGAAAYTKGSSIAFAGSPSLHTAAHEAAHVVQQRGGGVSLAGGVGKSGDSHEQHADRVADLVVQGKSAEALLDEVAGGGAVASASEGAVQRYIQIGGARNPRRLGTVDEAVQGIRDAIGQNDPSHIAAQFEARIDPIRGTIAGWLASRGETATNALEFGKAVVSGGTNAVGLGSIPRGVDAQWRVYDTFYEMGIALVHETHPQTVANKAHEGAIAAIVCANGTVNARLNQVKRLIYTKLSTDLGAVQKAVLTVMSYLPNFLGSYNMIGSYKGMPWFTSSFGFLNEDGGFENNIAVVHDFMEHMSGPGGGKKIPTGMPEMVPDPREEAYETTLLTDGADHMDFEPEAEHDNTVARRNRVAEVHGAREKRQAKRDQKGRTNVGTRDVKDIDTITGMRMHVPMLAGKSMTTARLMELVDSVGGTQAHKNAVAWAIFAYWAHLYPASTVPFHTFHEVMDIAKNFGVPYAPFHYPSEAEMAGAFYDNVGSQKMADSVPDGAAAL